MSLICRVHVMIKKIDHVPGMVRPSKPTLRQSSCYQVPSSQRCLWESVECAPNHCFQSVPGRLLSLECFSQKPSWWSWGGGEERGRGRDVGSTQVPRLLATSPLWLILHIWVLRNIIFKKRILSSKKKWFARSSNITKPTIILQLNVSICHHSIHVASFFHLCHLLTLLNLLPNNSVHSNVWDFGSYDLVETCILLPIVYNRVTKRLGKVTHSF